MPTMTNMMASGFMNKTDFPRSACVDPRLIKERMLILPMRKDQLQPNGIDLTIDKAYKVIGKAYLDEAGLKDQGLKKVEIKPTGDYFEFSPNAAYEVVYDQTIEVPDNMVALTFQRSSLNRSGCNIFGSVWDSGYKGKGSGTLKTSVPIDIKRHTRVAQIIFFWADSSSTYNGRYQNERIE